MSSLKNLVFGAGVLAMLALGVSACGPEYDRTEISAVKGEGTLGGTISTRRLDVPEGLVITAHLAVLNDDDEHMPLVVRSKDPSIIEVAPVVNPRNYAFIGRKQGSTQVEFVADGSVVLTIPANVLAQPELPDTR
ncbi:MAG: hypothetical protein KF764_20460 [Labilithrix sp.]|nr:hypothetical protein [Labilithrix sp.]